MSRSTSPSAYRLTSGSLLTPAEAAHLLTREASGEQLGHVPHRTTAGYVLTPRAALSPADLELHAHRVQLTADLLGGCPALTA